MHSLFRYAMALLLTAPTAWADDAIYKYRLPDGGVLYSQEKAAGAQLEEVLRVPSPSPAQAARAARELEQERALAAQLAAQRQQQQVTENRITQAEQALNAAQAALMNGIEPWPGERHATAGGGNRLSDAYWQRQRALRQSVEDARAQLDAVTAASQATRLSGAPAVESSGR
ncbi:MAG TPA: DUF4124 domain-containing protein [Noviherbaspirillum sp.]|nr:DUF4124 domain-containing protein [Noviherbaspirillum sp.]